MNASVYNTLVRVVEVPDLVAVVQVFEDVDDSSRVQRSHVDFVPDHVVVVVVIVVVYQQRVLVEHLAVAVPVSAVAARARDADRQPGGDKRKAESGAERSKGVDGGHRV